MYTCTDLLETRVPERRRYGLALEAALAEVETEFVLVVQHDWLFVRDADVRAAARASREL